MIFTDTHTHLYDGQFDTDREEVIARAISAGITKMYLPNCDLETVAPMMDMVRKWPSSCFPMMGLHPCYVKENYREVLDTLFALFEKHTFSAIGEIGLDFHWDTTYIREQTAAFTEQIRQALHKQLPIVIHTRKSLEAGIQIVSEMQNGRLRGVFHCFSGTPDDAKKITEMGFYIGVGGVATFKNSGLDAVIKETDLQHILLETDAPYLAPVPYRGKRNESAYIPLIAQKIADIKGIPVAAVAEQTTANARELFEQKTHAVTL